MEELAIYNCCFVYIKGSDNTVADTLSRYPCHPVHTTSAAEMTASHPFRLCNSPSFAVLNHPDPAHSPLSMIAALVDNSTITRPTSSLRPSAFPLMMNYWMGSDRVTSLTRGVLSYFQLQVVFGVRNLTFRDGLWFIGDRLIIPGGGNIDVFSE